MTLIGSTVAAQPLDDRYADGPAVRAGRGRRSPWVGTALAWVGLVAVWQLLASVVFAGQYLVGSPVGIAADLVAKADLYGRALLYTGGEAVRGYLWGTLTAAAVAAVVAVVPRTERLVLRVALVVYCLPLVALGPLLRLVFGLGDEPQVALAAVVVFYMTLVPLLVGLRAVPSTWVDLVASYGRGRFTTLLTVRARACVPYLAAGLQVSVPAAFLGALVGEFTGAERGLGVLSILALRSLDTDGLWALSAISAAVSVGGYVLVGWVAARLAADQPPVLLAAPPDPAGPRTAWVRRLRGLGEGLATAVLVVAAWWFALWALDLNRYFAKGPAEVWQWLVTHPQAAAHRTEILDALGSTVVVTVPGYVAGLALGVVMACAFELSTAVRRTVTPIAVALRCVPIIAIAPLLVQALGRGGVGTTVVVAIMTFFPTLVACLYGLRQAPGQVLDVFATFSTPRWRVLLLARVPAMTPAFFSSARIAAPSALLAATVAEWLATGTGIGNLMAVTAATSAYGTLWSTVVVVTVVAVAAYGVVEAVERWVLVRVAPEQVSW